MLPIKQRLSFIILNRMRRELNLQDYEPPVLSYNLASETQGGKQSMATFTDQFKMKDMKVQTLIRNSEKASIDIQVTPSLIQKDFQQDLQRSNLYPQGNSVEVELTQDTLKKIQRFLRKTAPLMNKQLQENLPLYGGLGKENQTNFKRQSRLAHTLENIENNEDKMDIAAVDWNASGVIVAAGYSKFQHDTTCSHKGFVCLWGIFKRNFKPNKPEVISVPNCVNCLNFHPKKPSVFAVGTFIGQILLYDFSRKDDPLLGKTMVDDYFHKDCITKISWWAYRPPGKPETNYNLLSLASDGKILLWEVPNSAIAEENKPKGLLKFPIKGFLMLRKKQNVIIPVSGLTMTQSISNKNIFIVGSEGGSILRATLAPINHLSNAQGKLMLDLQQAVKFKPQVYPFLLNLLPKNVREIKTHVQKICQLNKIQQVDSIATILNTRPEPRNLYPNPITFAYEALAYPISSISYNRYGLFIANGGEGYSRIYLQQQREHIQSIEEGYEWKWISNGSRIGGFIEQEFVVIDWAEGKVEWSVGIGEGLSWAESSLGMIAVICDKTKLKILELGDKLLEEGDLQRQKVSQRIEELASRQQQ